jgi:hypothetical protein
VQIEKPRYKVVQGALPEPKLVGRAVLCTPLIANYRIHILQHGAFLVTFPLIATPRVYSLNPKGKSAKNFPNHRPGYP